MRRVLLGLTCLIVLAAAGVGAALYITRPKPSVAPVARAHRSAQSYELIERGRYLTAAADCAACHTDQHGGKRLAGGRPIETPFGIIKAPNITPDPETGIGNWSSQDFANALQRGFSRDGHLLYPAMPYVYYTKASREDIDAIFAYLQTLEPVHNDVDVNRLPFPFNIRAAMRFWDLLYFRQGVLEPDPRRSQEWNRGAYLVQALEHCGACHTPKTWLGGDETTRAFQGYTVQGWFAPDINGDRRRGLGAWSTEDVVQLLRTGHTKATAVSGPMGEEITNSSNALHESDLRAMALYLKSLPSGTDDTPAAVEANTPAMQTGQAIYRDTCAACHRMDGRGVPGLFPSLEDSSAVQSREATSLVRVVVNGAKSVATQQAPTGAAMPSYGWQLNDGQVAAVLTYIRNAWGNAASAVSRGDVRRVRDILRDRHD